MDKNKLISTIKELKEKSSKRNFKQTFDLIVNLKELDMKKPEHQVDFFATLQHPRKKIKVCAFVGPELLEDARNSCDLAISQDEFEKYAKDKKLAKKLAREYDFFIAQANIMAPVATAFGRVLGPKGKMPNPKAGCVVPPKTSLRPLYEKLQKTIRISAKKDPIIQIAIGKEDGNEDEITDNVLTIYDQLIHHLINEKNNIKNVLLKLTMSKPIKLE